MASAVVASAVMASAVMTGVYLVHPPPPCSNFLEALPPSLCMCVNLEKLHLGKPCERPASLLPPDALWQLSTVAMHYAL